LAAADQIGEEFMRRGLRLTGQRAAVVRALVGLSGSFSVHELWLASRRNAAGLGIATVYRTLDLLVEMGAVQRVHGRDNCESFVMSQDEHKHVVVCRRCGATCELPDIGCTDFIADASRRTGFRIDDHLIQLAGVCPRCEKEQF
jgi:Fur family ferric uptake transcriptional regulator